MILLTGITGTTGSLLLQELSGKGIPLRATVRNPDKVKDLSIPGLEIVTGDFEDSASIEAALDGVDKAFMMMSNSPNQLECEKRFIDAAVKCNTGHLVKLSASSSQKDTAALLKKFHAESEEYLANSGLTWTSVRPNYYMQNNFASAQTIVADDKIFLPMGKGRVGAIDVRDVATFLAAVLTGSGHESKTYYITGSEILSFADMASQMSEVLGREIQYIDIPPEEFSKVLLSFGVDEWYVGALCDLFYHTARDDGARVTETFTEVTGQAPISFRDFVRDHAQVFTAAE